MQFMPLSSWLCRLPCHWACTKSCLLERKCTSGSRVTASSALCVHLSPVAAWERLMSLLHFPLYPW